jgi:multisubunit Na+/H+ antiporter MnhB subunit
MNNARAKYGEAGSFIAGVLIGASIVVPVIAMTVSDHNSWQTVEVFGALVALALGLALHFMVTAKPRRPQATEPELGALPAGWAHER